MKTATPTHRPTTFLGGVAVAFVLAAAGAASFAALTSVLTSTFAIRAISTLLAGAYLLYLLSRSEERTGRIVTIAAWLSGAVATGVFVTSLPLFIVSHVVMIWLVRTLYFHGSFTPALLDLGISALALATALWAVRTSGSLFLAAWCFFLVQALFVVVPEGTHARAQAGGFDDQPFKRAHRSAGAALHRLANSVNHSVNQ
jgi:hypothetical protein